jgi:hypothetical protein
MGAAKIGGRKPYGLRPYQQIERRGIAEVHLHAEAAHRLDMLGVDVERGERIAPAHPDGADDLANAPEPGTHPLREGNKGMLQAVSVRRRRGSRPGTWGVRASPRRRPAPASAPARPTCPTPNSSRRSSGCRPARWWP